MPREAAIQRVFTTDHTDIRDYTDGKINRWTRWPLIGAEYRTAIPEIRGLEKPALG